MEDISKLFGSLVFGERELRSYLTAATYNALKSIIAEGAELTPDVANEIASAMKDWAVSKGATHFTHWFQPMTGVTAEKHDSFVTRLPDGSAIMEFSGKELIKGEPDASSFPSGGLRATFEARGYTAWDPTSYAFIKDDSLCIPTVFCSYGGEVLDKKTPLLRSVQAIGAQALRIVRLFGDTETRAVVPMVGAEQEYFLVDKSLMADRTDVKYTGRTLFGAKPPKGQELEDHYFGAICPRVMEYMRDLNIELWKLGISARTEHNEAAPAQHELASVYTDANTAVDQNQLIMEMMKKVADKHNLVCLLHEKPFSGVNGSGKHNNWSLSTDSGENLFKPGRHPETNKRFLLFLVAVIKAVDKYPELLRLTVADAGNDRRLGGNEAPPAIISMYLGSSLTALLDTIADGGEFAGMEKTRMSTGVSAVPEIRKDTSDRNRTSPMAFTGNKFEFRMPGSSQSVAGPNIVLNTAVADVLREFADRLEKADDFAAETDAILRQTVTEHRRVIFNGNNYSAEWRTEAAKRGLCELKTTPDALEQYDSDKNIALFARCGIFTESELRSRRELLTVNYCNVMGIEAATMIDMLRRDILPSCCKYLQKQLDVAAAQEALVPESCGFLKRSAADYAKQVEKLDALTRDLESAVCESRSFATSAKAAFIRDSVIPCMDAVRTEADELEKLTPRKIWAFPSYGELLFSV